MKHYSSRPVSIAWLLGAALLAAGCSAGSGPQLAPPVAGQAFAPLQAAVGPVAPDVCGGKGTKVALDAAGGSLTLPPCGGFKGMITYGKNNAPAGTTVTLISTTKNPGGVPTPPKGTVVAFVQATGSSKAGSVNFQATSAKSTISNKKKLKSADKYSLYAYALGIPVAGFPQQLGSPVNGVLTFTSPLNGETVPEGITIDFELVQD